MYVYTHSVPAGEPKTTRVGMLKYSLQFVRRGGCSRLAGFASRAIKLPKEPNLSREGNASAAGCVTTAQGGEEFKGGFLKYTTRLPLDTWLGAPSNPMCAPSKRRAARCKTWLRTQAKLLVLAPVAGVLVWGFPFFFKSPLKMSGEMLPRSICLRRRKRFHTVAQCCWKRAQLMAAHLVPIKPAAGSYRSARSQQTTQL